MRKKKEAPRAQKATPKPPLTRAEIRLRNLNTLMQKVAALEEIVEVQNLRGAAEACRKCLRRVHAVEQKMANMRAVIELMGEAFSAYLKD